LLAIHNNKKRWCMKRTLVVLILFKVTSFSCHIEANNDVCTKINCTGDACQMIMCDSRLSGPHCSEPYHGSEIHVRNNSYQPMNVYIDVYFNEKYSHTCSVTKLDGSDSRYIGCSKWQGQGVPPNPYHYKIKKAIYDDNHNKDKLAQAISCTCGGQSITKTCPHDGFCECSGNTPKITCTKECGT
jgi:hypothetical protein